VKSGIFVHALADDWDSLDDEGAITSVIRSARLNDERDREERSARLARMASALRLVERDLFTITPQDPTARDAHALRVARAHALALIDLLDEIATRAD
jgi:hypothetical protein